MHIITPYDKTRETDKQKSYNRIMWLFKQYQRTGDKETYLAEIQDIVNKMDERFYIEFRVKDKPKPYRIMFVPERMKGIG
jgi:hypothetical protein